MPRERFQIEVQLKAETSLHITGPGRTLPLVDRSVALDEAGFPFIQASSFRGRARAHLERLLMAFDKPVCTPPRPQLMCPHHPFGVEQVQELQDGNFCLACQIFGSAWKSSPIAFSDLKAAYRDKAKQTPWIRTGIGIDRRLGTVAEQKLFTLEVIPSQVEGAPLSFGGDIQGRLARQELGWLIGAMRMITHIGGVKARGLGRVNVEKLEVKLWDETKRDWVNQGWQSLVKEAVDHGTRKT